ncbi:hypothetical protein [Oceanimonas baumannii]|uniref:Uncharacterized protein n=1 Tax=Oceanimonas baumannii TaxID=129578 RepID=A0A235CKI9_9GAMM|nr:hypothetical protein [Oceanimonas baumannii]MCC4265129.1 hypothetical protein [Oceanimonas baumannii]OYD25052.1 hypothetical protein B6S09_07620 [Oceanimonas baumannii]TDW59832.1 hypothetical protein LY04_01473 [Oceanimonas baumannii]
MKKLTLCVIGVFFGILTGCDTQGPGPVADVGDHIDEVVENGVHSETTPELPAEAKPEPEVIEQQKKHHQQVVEQASKEAEDKLNAILNATAEPE